MKLSLFIQKSLNLENFLWKSCFTSILTAFIGLIIWIFLFFALYPEEKPYLIFPEKKNLSIKLLANIQSPTPLKIRATLIGTPSLLKNGSSYFFQFKEFEVLRPSEISLLSFKRLPGFIAEYHTDHRLSDSERRAIYSAFAVDLTHFNSSEDTSYLQETFSLFLSDSGKIEEICLSSRLKNLLYLSFINNRSLRFIKEFLNSPNKLPSLLPSHLSNQWQNEGHFIFPMTFNNSIKEQSENFLKIRTEAKIKEGKKPFNYLKSENSSISSFEWNMDWIFSPKEHLIKTLSLQFKLGTTEELLSKKIEYECAFNTEIEISFEEKEAIYDPIKELGLRPKS